MEIGKGVKKAYDWFKILSYLEQHALTDKYFQSVNPSRLSNGQVLEIYIEETYKKEEEESKDNQMNKGVCKDCYYAGSFTCEH